MKDQNTDVHASTASPRIAAIVLIVVNVLSILAMLHHPTAHGDSPADFLQALTKMGGFNELVHGLLIGTTLLTWLCLIHIAMPHLKQAHVRNGILLYSLGILAIIGAGLTNGFVILRLAEGLADASEELRAASPLLFQMAWAINQTLTGFAVIAMCAGIASWSLHLFSGTKFARALAIAALVMVVLQLGMQWVHNGHFGVHEMLAFVLWHAAWCIAMAALVIRQR